MENAPFGVQLELLEFEKLTDDTSKLSIHTIFESVAAQRSNAEIAVCSGHKYGT